MAQITSKNPVRILEPDTGLPRGSRRLIHTSDMGSHFGRGTFLFGDPAEPDHLRKWIRNVAAGGADTYVPEVYFDGLIAYYRSRRCPNWKSPAFARFDAMMDGGVMPLDIFVDEARNQGIELLAGFRMNDRHGINKPFFEAHPNWILKDLGHGVDYSLPEVRDWIFSIMQEVPERFDVDGIELNFVRHGYCFPPSEARDRHPLMSEFMRRLRAMLDRTGEKKGRRLLMGVRVPTTVEECRHFGFDVPTWVGEGLVDYVAPTDYHYTNFNMKVEQFASIVRAADSCYLYPAIQADVPGNCTIMTLDNYRAAVRNFHEAGADGVSTHNYDVYMWGQLRSKSYPGPADMYPKALGYFNTLKNPDAVAAGDRHYLFLPLWAHELHPKGYRGIGIPHHRATVSESSPSAVFPFRICEHLPERTDLSVDERGVYAGSFNRAGKPPGAWLIFRAVGKSPEDEIAVTLNGREIPADTIRSIWHPQGRPAWEGRPLPPHTELRVNLTSPPGVYGDNTLGIGLVGKNRAEPREITVDEVEVVVNVVD